MDITKSILAISLVLNGITVGMLLTHEEGPNSQVTHHYEYNDDEAAATNDQLLPQTTESLASQVANLSKRIKDLALTIESNQAINATTATLANNPNSQPQATNYDFYERAEREEANQQGLEMVESVLDGGYLSQDESMILKTKMTEMDDNEQFEAIKRMAAAVNAGELELAPDALL